MLQLREGNHRRLIARTWIELDGDLMFSGLGRAFGASATWDLSSLVFNSSELDAYSLVGIHEDVRKARFFTQRLGRSTG